MGSLFFQEQCRTGGKCINMHSHNLPPYLVQLVQLVQPLLPHTRARKEEVIS